MLLMVVFLVAIERGTEMCLNYFSRNKVRLIISHDKKPKVKGVQIGSNTTGL